MAITRVNSRDILDRTIRNVDVHDNAEIADTKLATISTTGKVSNSATTGTSSATPNTIVLRDGSGKANFNAVHAVQSITSDALVRAPAIEGAVSVAVTSDNRTTPPIIITRNNVGAGIMTGLDFLTVTDTTDTGTLLAVHVATTTGTIAEAPVNGTDIANKDYVDSVATAGSITGDLVAGRVVLSTGLHTISDSDLFKFDPVAKTFSIRTDVGVFPNECGISVEATANGTIGIYADEFSIYAQASDAMVFQSSCPDDIPLIAFHGATPVGKQETVEHVVDPVVRRSTLRMLADGLVEYGLFHDNISLPTYPFTPVKVEEGGTGLDALGGALEVLRVNAGGTALEYSSAGSGDISGTLVSGEVVFATGAQTVGTSSDFTFNSGTGNMAVSGEISSINIYESGDNNIAIGKNAFNRAATFATHNIAIGNGPQKGMVSGTHNIGIGLDSQYSLDDSFNIAIGNSSQYNLVTGANNIAIGDHTQYAAAVSYGNIGLGHYAQYSLNGGAQNIGIGKSAQYDLVDGNDNVSLGEESQRNITSGDGNVCIGYQSGFTSGSSPSNTNALTTGDRNTFIGYQTGFNTSTQRTNATAIGSGAYVDADNTVALGNAAVTTVMAGSSGAARVVAGSMTLNSLLSFANNAAAISGGLTVGQLYTIAGSNPRALAIVY